MEKSLQKDEFSKDLDETINWVIQAMMMALFVIVLVPMLPIAKSAQQYLQSQQFVGETESRILRATQVPQHIVLDHPWVSAYFVNNGPDTVYLKINSSDSSPYPLGVYETLTINRLGAQNRIYAVYYQCDTGCTAEVEVIGEY